LSDQLTTVVTKKKIAMSAPKDDSLTGRKRSRKDRIDIGDEFDDESTPAQDVLEHVAEIPDDVILRQMRLFRDDANPKKVDLGVGAYKDDEGRSLVFGTVRKAEVLLTASHAGPMRIYDELQPRTEATRPKDGLLDKDYPGMRGVGFFLSGAQTLLFGEDHGLHVASVQTVAGSAACRIAFELFLRFLPDMKIFAPNPTWGNHHYLWSETYAYHRGAKLPEYQYINPDTLTLDLEGMTQNLTGLRRGSIVLFHLCGHNPTGVDPNKAQWDAIADVVKERSLVPFIDAAYQGLVSGSTEDDAYFLRKLVEIGVPTIVVAQSFSKNMGLYGERVGALHVVCESEETARKVTSQLKMLTRGIYSMPPIHGARIAGYILSDPTLRMAWEEELRAASLRLWKVRSLLVAELVSMGTPHPLGVDWSVLASHGGMFSYTGLPAEVCYDLREEHSVYMVPATGRLCFCGLNEGNVVYVAEAIDKAVRRHMEI